MTQPDAATAPLPRPYTLIEAARYFRVSRRTFQDLIRLHPFYRTLGRRKLFAEADLAALYEALPGPRIQSPQPTTAKGRHHGKLRRDIS